MTEEKAQYSTAPADLNELKRRVEERGTNWNDALVRLKKATGGKDIAAAMREGWSIEDFWKTLTSGDERLAKTVEKYQDTGPIEGMAYVPPSIPAPAPQDNGQHFTEAPASFNVKAISPAGFDVMLTLRDDDATRLWKRAKAALAWLSKNGFSPTPARGGNRRGNNGVGNGEAPSCPTHGKAMKPSQYGGWYCPVKIADDDGAGKPVYCKQKIG